MAEYAGGGFADSAEVRLPEEVFVRAQVADELDRRQVAQEEHRRAERARLFEMRSIQASAVLAEDRGELVDRRRALTHGVGHTPAEFLKIIAAQQDAEDVRSDGRNGRSSSCGSGSGRKPRRLTCPRRRRMRWLSRSSRRRGPRRPTLSATNG
jgi:hypothetical protein